MRDKIKVTFADLPIQSLAQFDAELFNEGSETIQRAALTVTFPNATGVLDARISPDDSGAVCEIQDNRVNITLPYLNSIRDHKQRLTLTALANGDTSKVTVSGAGEGWSARYLPLPNFKQQRNATRATLIATLAFSAITRSPTCAG